MPGSAYQKILNTQNSIERHFKSTYQQIRKKRGMTTRQGGASKNGENPYADIPADMVHY